MTSPDDRTISVPAAPRPHARRVALFSLALAGALSLSSFSAAMAQTNLLKSDVESGITDTVIKIGWMGDESGATASSGLPMLHGLQAYADHVNSAGGLFGRKLQVIDLDDATKPDNARVNFRRLVNDDKVLAIANLGGSQVVTPLAQAVVAAKMPILFPVQTVDLQLQVPYFFNITSHFADQADVIVASAGRAVGGANKLKLFVVRLNVPSGEEFDGYVQKSLAKQGGSYGGNATVAFTANDFTPVVVAIRQAAEAGANAVALHGPSKTGIGIMSAMVRNGLSLPVVGIQALASPEVFTNAPAEAVAKFSAVQSVLPATSGVPGAKDIAAYVKAHSALAAEAGEPYFAQGWIAGLVFDQALRNAARDNAGAVNRDTLYKALQGKFDTGGLSCALDFTALHYTPCATTIGWNGKSLVANDEFQSFSSILRREYSLK